MASIEPRSSSAAVSWQTSVPAQAVLEYGLTQGFGVWTKPTSTPATSGKLLLAGLEPNTTYHFHLVARAGADRSETLGSFRTAGILPWTTATTTANALFLDWQPFFPRMVFGQCPDAYGRSIAAGINLFMGSDCTSGAGQLGALGGRAYSVLGSTQVGVDYTGMIGWHQPDEPDLILPPSALPTFPTRVSHRVSFLTLSNHFFSASAPGPAARSSYPDYVAKADMIGFDLYPLQNWCRRATLAPVYQAQRELTALAAGKPTYQWIEAAPMSQCGGLDPSPALVRAETWLAIAGGARGIGYFPGQWRQDVTAEIGRINVWISSLAPALLSAERPVTVTPAEPVYAGARTYDGATYVIAVNSWLPRATVKIEVPGLTAKTVQVWGEGRSLPVTNGAITDFFRGLGVHIYVAPPALS